MAAVREEQFRKRLAVALIYSMTKKKNKNKRRRWMCTTRFDDLLKRVSPYVKHAKTHRTPISTMERLALTLRVLACGATQQSVAETFKIGPSTARKILAEMCKTIWMALKDEFVAAPSQTRWATIATDF
ncbi:hypothetical protein QQF64_001139 [Cirrhinus molitorella]|uniref:Nuclease HARBI1 n=1 Tax=Cirrhinus molitorella TaxID=172907 RepID=A0ABR3P0K8_9TELE